MAKNNVVEYVIKVKDSATSTIKRIGGAIAGFAKGLLSQGANIHAWGQMIGNVFGRIQQAAGAVWGAIREAFKFETLTTQFKTLLGSMDAAETRMKMLAKVAEETPFDMEGVVKASRILTVMSKDALGTEWALKLVGDTAAATGGSIEELATWIGRAYAMIQAGKPFGEAAMRLTELGAMTPEVRDKMEALQASGAANSQVWATLVDHLESFSGAMLDLSKTGDGLTSTLEDNWTAAVRDFGNAFVSAAKDSIQFLINKIAELQASGAITEWAERAQRALEPLRNLIVGILGDGNSRSQAFAAAWDYLRQVVEYAGTTLKNAAIYAGDYLHSKILDAVASLSRWSDKNLGAMMREAADQRFTITQKKAALELEDAGENLARATKEAAEQGKRAVEENLAKVQVAQESPETKAARLAQEKQRAQEALNAAEAEKRAKKEAEKRAKKEAEKVAEAQRREKERQDALPPERIRREQWAAERLEEWRQPLAERLRVAKNEREERRKRVLDSDYAREQERAEREKKREDARYAHRQARFLQRMQERRLDIFAGNFDASRLTRAERRMRDAVLAERQVRQLEDLQKKAFGDIDEIKKNTAVVAHEINNILSFK